MRAFGRDPTELLVQPVGQELLAAWPAFSLKPTFVML